MCILHMCVAVKVKQSPNLCAQNFLFDFVCIHRVWYHENFQSIVTIPTVVLISPFKKVKGVRLECMINHQAQRDPLWKVILASLCTVVYFIEQLRVSYNCEVNHYRHKYLMNVSHYMCDLISPSNHSYNWTLVKAKYTASYLDLLLLIGSDGQFYTSIYDKLDNLNFKRSQGHFVCFQLNRWHVFNWKTVVA